jgi:hypothetical protein
MKRCRAHELHQAKKWCIAFGLAFVIGSCSVAYAYAGEQIPKDPTTPLILALAASFGAH